MQEIVTYAGWITTIIGCVTAIVVAIKKGFAALNKPLAQIRAENAQQTRKLDKLSDDVSRLAGDRLNQAHEFYIDRGWCPGSKKRQLEQWYMAYKAGGHNHLADRYLQDLIALPELPPTVN